METIYRKQMPTTQAVLKIVIGAVSIFFIVGIFLILGGIKEIKRIKQNNSANNIALQISSDGCVEVNDFYGNNFSLSLDSIKGINLSNVDTLCYLFYQQDGNQKSICLGYIENVKVRYFNSLVA